MRNYEKKISELGIDKNQLSRALSQSVKEFEEGENEYVELSQRLESMSEDDDDYEEVQSEVQEYEELLEQTDLELTAKIEKWYGKRDYYAAKMEHMRNASSGKPASQSPKMENGKAAANTAVHIKPSNVGQEEKKDKGSWILWAGLGLLGLMVGANIMRRE
jgi:chromosome segregation ATPase